MKGYCGMHYFQSSSSMELIKYAPYLLARNPTAQVTPFT